MPARSGIGGRDVGKGLPSYAGVGPPATHHFSPPRTADGILTNDRRLKTLARERLAIGLFDTLA